jgi:hypothetical protein
MWRSWRSVTRFLFHNYHTNNLRHPKAFVPQLLEQSLDLVQVGGKKRIAAHGRHLSHPEAFLPQILIPLDKRFGVYLVQLKVRVTQYMVVDVIEGLSP